MLRETLFTTMNKLGYERGCFSSEADFQFAFAWELQKLLPNAKIRLEYCPAFDRKMHIDIFVETNGYTFSIELKYKTKIFKNNEYSLKGHGAQDFGRYDYIKDISRIEAVKCSDKRFKGGYAIMLTNDPSYWEIPTNQDSDDSDFRIHEGRVLQGEPKWKHTPSFKDKKERKVLVLNGSYSIKWHIFSRIQNEKNGIFKYLVTEVY